MGNTKMLHLDLVLNFGRGNFQVAFSSAKLEITFTQPANMCEINVERMLDNDFMTYFFSN